ncbi:MAG: amidohydrolase [Psychroflexus halocasei]
MSSLAVSYLQTDLIWESPEENRQKFEKYIVEEAEKTDLIILQEMFTTGFSMHPEGVAEAAEPTLSWLQNLAQKHDVAITGSVMLKENEKYYNRLYFVKPDGETHQYDKKHLFSLAKEERAYTSGHKKLIVDYKGWKICPLICYDLRFPAWSRNLEDYDLLLYVANWPQKRITAWDALLKARAIENMAFVVGVNRTGKDINDFPYVGHSAIYDYLGKRISTHDLENPHVVEHCSLDKNKLYEAREKFGFLKDRDDFTLN